MFFLFVCDLFFFFKQKTAYEMRISDWSSDVCSSDLLQDSERRQADTVAGDQPDQIRAGGDAAVEVAGMKAGRADDAADERAVAAFDELGRASGRERVCQYV